MRVVGGAVLAGLSVLGACAGDDGSTEATLPLEERPARLLVPDDSVEEAESLSESQQSAETVAPPELPPLCDASDIDVWTAQVIVRPGSADAVLRLRNDGDVRCEVGIGGSPFVAPAIEPDVWLEPGDWADLVVGQSADDCDEPSAVHLAQIDINGDEIVVPTAAVATCGWRLTSFYEAERADVPCVADDLESVVVGEHVLVRNTGFRSCRLGDLDGPTPATLASPSIVDLAGGDVVAWPVSTGCATEASVLTFGQIAVPVDRCVEAVGGPGGPYFGPHERPLRAADPFDVETALAALDPFAG